VGYGGTGSRYEEEKRVVQVKDVGPLISMQEMSRCIHCTRCVRFGQEVAGVMELGMSHRGEHAEIETFVGQSVDSELSGNMIDLCPVGALTSKPFRYSARTWELSRRKSISPHDSTGANLIVQVKGSRVMRVVPLENDAVNECWIADRDRFSYEALNSDERLTTPMIKQGGTWHAVDWQTALEYVAKGLKQIGGEFGAKSLGALVSPHSTLEELQLATQLMRGLGSPNIDHRLRNAEFPVATLVRSLGMPIAALSELQSVLVVGSNLRKDHPLFALRIRHAARRGAVVSAIGSGQEDWAMPIENRVVVAPSHWVTSLVSVALAVAAAKSVTAPFTGEVTDGARLIAASLLSGERNAILLGNGAAHHSQASSLLAVAQWIGDQIGAKVGYLTEAANTVGAQLVGALPGADGLDAGQMLSGSLKAVLLLNTEPEFDSAVASKATDALKQAQMVVSLSPFKANMDCCDVMLPVGPFTETSGTFVNAEGLAQSFHAVVKPLGETRPAWKVLRVLANTLNLPGFDFNSSQEVLQSVSGLKNGVVSQDRLSNRTTAAVDTSLVSGAPMVATAYQLDGIVRRASSLQMTSDARSAKTQGVPA
jgi:NADH-quinone oxidoreductase subunit G